jgi:chromosome segregation ATPase
VALVAALVTLAGLMLAGCGTGGLAVKKDIWEAQSDFEQRQAGLSEKVLQMDGRISALEEELSVVQHRVDELSTQFSGLDSDFSRGLEAIRDGQQQLGIELEGRIRNVDEQRKTDRSDLLERMQIVLDEVTAENKRLRAELDEVKSAVSVGATHRVQRGETLASIAAQYGVTVQAIAAANNIANPDLIAVGQELIIPGK